MQSVLYRRRQSTSTTCQYCLLDDETVQHFLTECEHWSRERRLCGITDCDAYVILDGNNITDIENLLKFVSLVSLADLEAFDDDTSSLARLSSSLLWVADLDVRAEEVFESLR